MSPTQRSLAFFKELPGVHAEVVERWIPGACIRKDYLGIFDLLVLEPGRSGVTGVQVCARASAAARRTKMQESGYLSLWLQTGNRALLHSWAKEGPRGTRKLWRVKVEEVAP